MKRIVYVISILLASIAGCNSHKPPLKTGLEGTTLPSFSILSADSSTYFNTSRTLGKPVVLFYFSPRCPYCRAQMGAIIKDITKLQDIQFYVFTTYPFDEMRSFYRHYGLTRYPNLKVGVDYKNFFESYFKVAGLPYTAIYNNHQRLREVFLGNLSAKQIKEVAER